MPPPTWIHHISLSVTDADRSAAWYRRVLGVEDAGRRDGTMWQRVLLQGGNFILSFTAHSQTQPIDTFDPERVGLDHVGIGCRDRDELLAWVRHIDDLGITRSDIIEAPHAVLFTCPDPDGIPLEFYWFID